MVDIVFAESDYKYGDLESAAENVASYVYNNRSLIFVLSDILRVSAPWEYSIAVKELTIWETERFGIQKIKAKVLVQKVKEAYSICTSTYQKNKIRGLIPEKLAFSLLNNKHYEQSKNGKGKYRIGSGCIVRIGGKDVIYKCCSPYVKDDDSDDNRQTVDVAVWNSIIGEFGEIKASPHRFHTKDIKYLRTLANELNAYNFSYTLYLISTQAPATIQSKLEELKLWNPHEFALIGSNNFFDLAKV